MDYLFTSLRLIKKSRTSLNLPFDDSLITIALNFTHFSFHFRQYTQAKLRSCRSFVDLISLIIRCQRFITTNRGGTVRFLSFGPFGKVFSCILCFAVNNCGCHPHEWSRVFQFSSLHFFSRLWCLGCIFIDQSTQSSYLQLQHKVCLILKYWLVTPILERAFHICDDRKTFITPRIERWVSESKRIVIYCHEF